MGQTARVMRWGVVMGASVGAVPCRMDGYGLEGEATWHRELIWLLSDSGPAETEMLFLPPATQWAPLLCADDKAEKGEEKDPAVVTQSDEAPAEEDHLGPNCYYDKSKSFFDNISSELKTRSEGGGEKGGGSGELVGKHCLSFQDWDGLSW